MYHNHEACPHCDSTFTQSKGGVGDRSKHHCTSCKANFSVGYVNAGSDPAIRARAKQMLRQGYSRESITMQTKVSKGVVAKLFKEIVAEGANVTA